MLIVRKQSINPSFINTYYVTVSSLILFLGVMFGGYWYINYHITTWTTHIAMVTPMTHYTGLHCYISILQNYLLECFILCYYNSFLNFFITSDIGCYAANQVIERIYLINVLFINCKVAAWYCCFL